MTHSLIKPFSTPLEVWSQREATDEEFKQQLAQGGTPAKAQFYKDKLLTTITSEEEAAEAFLRYEQSKTNHRIKAHVIQQLKTSSAFKQWRHTLPGQTPKQLMQYKTSPSSCDMSLVDTEIKQNGLVLPRGQKLFRSAFWTGSKAINQPMSTTFCPQVAISNLHFNAKAFDAGAVHLWVLTVNSDNVPAFPYSITQGKLAHEYEVLLASGAPLSETGRKTIVQDYRVTKAGTHGEIIERLVPASVIYVDVT